MGSVGSTMNEIMDYATMVISVCVIYIVGSVILTQILGAGLINNTSSFYGTIAQVNSIWNSSTGMMVAAVIIVIATIVIRQLRGGFK